MEEIQRHVLKQKNNFLIYETVHYNKCVICSNLIMSQFLSTLEERKRHLDVCFYLETRFQMSVNTNWQYITTSVP